MKCASYRRNQIAADAKVGELAAQLAERDKRNQAHLEEMQTLIEEVQKLKGQLTAAEVVISDGQKEGFAAGREAGLAEDQKEGFKTGHAQGLEEGQAGRITLEEHHQALSSSCVSVARDFLKCGMFKTAVEIKSADFYNKGYRIFVAQIETLGGFVDSFYRSRMDITLDGKLQP
ncbi:UNVERIFIED_CONTAM: hypothetical protein Sindi_0946500 [Sesamum indicum]